MTNDDITIIEPTATNVKYSGFECFFAWFSILGGYLFCRALPADKNPLGMFLVAFSVLAVTFVALIVKGVRFNAPSIVSALISAILSAAIFISADPFAQLLAFCGSVMGYSYFVYSACGNKLQRGMSDMICVDFFKALVLLPFSAFGRVWAAMFSGKRVGGKMLLKVLLGIAIAVVPTVTVISLLSYDDSFSKILSDIFVFFRGFKLFSHLFSLAMGGLVAMYIFGLYSACVNRKLYVGIDEFFCGNAYQNTHFIPTVTVAVALLPLVAVYVIFFISQWNYYISAFSGVLPEGLTYAEYARSGFFELCSVSAINILILALAAFFTKRKGKGDTALLKTANTLISVMTLVLIATAFSKMAIYVQSYGLTAKRVIASWFMVLLALVFVLIILKQFINRLKLIPASGIVVAAMVMLLTLSNYNGIIADYNVDKYISGDLDSVDVHALYDLGTPALPAILRYAEHYESETGAKIKENVTDESDFSELKEDEAAYYTVYCIRGLKGRLERKSLFTAFSVPDIVAQKAIEDYIN